MGSFHGFLDIDGVASALLLDPLFYGIRGTHADAAAFDVHAAHAGLGGEGYEGDLRLPMVMVMVPVLSSMRTSMSPAASTARPLVAMTLRRMRRSMPLMPMALSGLADDGRFIDAGNAFDDITVGGDHVTGFADDEIALFKHRRRRAALPCRP